MESIYALKKKDFAWSYMTLTSFKVRAHPLTISNLKMENEPDGKNKQNLKNILCTYTKIKRKVIQAEKKLYKVSKLDTYNIYLQIALSLTRFGFCSPQRCK